MPKAKKSTLELVFDEAFMGLPEWYVIEDKDYLSLRLKIGEWKKIINDIKERVTE